MNHFELLIELWDFWDFWDFLEISRFWQVFEWTYDFIQTIGDVSGLDFLRKNAWFRMSIRLQMCWWQNWDIGDQFNTLSKSPTKRKKSATRFRHQHLKSVTVSNIAVSPTSMSPVISFKLVLLRLQYVHRFSWQGFTDRKITARQSESFLLRSFNLEAPVGIMIVHPWCIICIPLQ